MVNSIGGFMPNIETIKPLYKKPAIPLFSRSYLSVVKNYNNGQMKDESLDVSRHQNNYSEMNLPILCRGIFSNDIPGRISVPEHYFNQENEIVIWNCKTRDWLLVALSYSRWFDDGGEFSGRVLVQACTNHLLTVPIVISEVLWLFVLDNSEYLRRVKHNTLHTLM